MSSYRGGRKYPYPGGGPYPNRSPLYQPPIKRYCSNCAAEFPEQGLIKLRSCPKCQHVVVNSNNEWDASGWGRCERCFNLIHREFCFCELCGYGNQIGQDLKKKRVAEAKKREQQARAEKAKADAEQMESMRAEIALLRAEQAKWKAQTDEDMLLREMEIDEKGGEELNNKAPVPAPHEDTPGA